MHPSVHPFFLQKKARARKGDAPAIFDTLARYALQRKSFLHGCGARPHDRSKHSNNEDHMDSLADRLAPNLRWEE